jgi:hypothetical protein
LHVITTEGGGNLPALPARNLGNDIPDHFENFLPIKLLAKGFDDRREKTSFDLTPLQNPDLIQFRIAAHRGYLT